MNEYQAVLLREFNPSMALCMTLLKLRRSSVQQFRDAWFTEAGDEIYVLGRIGGHLARSYGITYERLRSHTLYIEDHGDRQDPTYNMFRFSTPEAYKEDCL
jgi:hypothetical protein